MDTIALHLRLLILAALVVFTLMGCSSVPEVRTVVVPQERVHIQRPELPIERLTKDANAAQVFQAYEESLLICIGYAKQLEAANK